MKIITISREFGSGGRELGKRLSDAFGCDYYDREIVTEIAEREKLDSRYVEKTLEISSMPNLPFSCRNSFLTMGTMLSPQTELLLAQKRVLEKIAKSGKDCVIVGRNADVILQEYQPFNLFVCADMQAKIERCKQRADKDENLSDNEIEKRIKTIDKNRIKTRSIISGSGWGERQYYNLIVNTTGWEIKELTPLVAEFIRRWYEVHTCK